MAESKDGRVFRLDLTLEEFAMLTTMSSIGTALVWSRMAALNRQFPQQSRHGAAADRMATETANDFINGPFDRAAWGKLQDRMLAMTVAQPDAVLVRDNSGGKRG